MPDATHLVIFDADRIKDFVFATGRLKEIRGGSQLVRDGSDEQQLLTHLQLTPKLAPAEIIFAEGGAGVLQFTDAARAQNVAVALSRHYRGMTHGATLTAVVQSGADFQDAKRKGDRRLRIAKEDRRRQWQAAHSPFSQACTSCGAQPATKVYTGGGRQEPLCAWCCAKRARADKMSRQEVSGQRFLLEQTGWGSDFLKHIEMYGGTTRADLWRSAQLPATTDKLAELSRPGNYLGFLYADGNSMGSHLAQCADGDAYRAFSTRVSQSLRAALWHALDHHFPHGPVNDTAPFEVIALGGDDLMLLCTADQAIPVAITLGALFRRICQDLAKPDAEVRYGRRSLAQIEEVSQAARAALEADRALPDEAGALTLSSAVILAHPKQPILNLEEQARQMLGAAKRAYPGQSVLDFHLVSSPVLRSMRDIRRQEYRLDERTLLTARPFLLHEMDTLFKHVHRLKFGGENDVLPRNKLNAFYQALFSERESATFETLFLYYRLARGQRDSLAAFLKAFGIELQPTTDKPGMPWGANRLSASEYFTVLADLAELYDFVSAPPTTSSPATTSSQEAVT